MESGFGSLSAFSQSFRKTTGQSASDFRRLVAAHRLGATG
jgi:AraC-like DNA-binding protein